MNSQTHTHTPPWPQPPRWSPMLRPPERLVFLQLWETKWGGGGLCQRMFSNIVNPNVRSFKVTENLCKNEKTQIMKGVEKREGLYLFVLCCKDPPWSCKLSLADRTTARANLSSLFLRYYATGWLSQVELICPQETCSFIDFTIKQSRLNKSSTVESLPISFP